MRNKKVNVQEHEDNLYKCKEIAYRQVFPKDISEKFLYKFENAVKRLQT